jgi:hypothetical protein
MRLFLSDKFNKKKKKEESSEFYLDIYIYKGIRYL